MTTANMKIVGIADLVKGTKMVGDGDNKKVLLIVNAPSVKAFRDMVINKSDVRHTKRWMPERDIDNAVKHYVRGVAGFAGRRLRGIEVVAATKNDNVVRTATGLFTKI